MQRFILIFGLFVVIQGGLHRIPLNWDLNIRNAVRTNDVDCPLFNYMMAKYGLYFKALMRDINFVKR